MTPIPGVLEDYTFLVRGLLDLYEACYDPWCLEWASKLQTTQDCLFWDAADGGYYNSVSTDASIVLRLKEGKYLYIYYMCVCVVLYKIGKLLIFFYINGLLSK